VGGGGAEVDARPVLLALLEVLEVVEVAFFALGFSCSFCFC
jgi:hypothetical protein